MATWSGVLAAVLVSGTATGNPVAETFWLELVTVRGTLQVELGETPSPAAESLMQGAEGGAFELVSLTVDRRPEGLLLGLVAGRAWIIGRQEAWPDESLYLLEDGRPAALVGTLVSGQEVLPRLVSGDRVLRVRSGKGTLPVYYPVLTGWLTRSQLDGQIPGWAAERERYAPEQRVLDRLAAATQHYGLHVVLGTWCPDTRLHIPHLERVLDALGERSPFSEVAWQGVDRTKEVVGESWPFDPVHVIPTVVVSFGGVEIGRISESPVHGSVERDLASMLSHLEGWGPDHG